MTAVGIDVSKAMLDLAFNDATKVHRFHNTAAGIRRLVELLRARPGGQKLKARAPCTRA